MHEIPHLGECAGVTESMPALTQFLNINSRTGAFDPTDAVMMRFDI